MGIRFNVLLTTGVLLSIFLLLIPTVFPLSGERGSDWMAAMGRFHILALHFPIVLLLIIPLLELLGTIPSFRFVRPTIPLLLGLAILFAANACVLGYLLATGEGHASELLTNHMWAGMITTVLMITALILRQLHSHFKSKPTRWGYIVVLGISIFFLTIGSHDGASLVHGEDYLYAKLPPSIKAALQLGSPKARITKDSLVYETLVKPIFKQHCFLCHSEAKQKGDFRMDGFESLLSAGMSGKEGIAPGNLADSAVHYRITLDPKKRGFMPPAGNIPLSEDQIAAISWWIEQGASPTQTLADLSTETIPEFLQQQLDEWLNPPQKK
ncbi:MAG: c-type cytochrome domain-containing protein [Pontiella sp.]